MAYDQTSFLSGLAVGRFLRLHPPGGDPPLPVQGDFLIFRFEEAVAGVGVNSSVSYRTGNTLGKGWDGVVEYSYDAQTWTEWDGSAIPCVGASPFRLYMRGRNNTYLSQSGYDSGSYSRFVFGYNANVSIDGNLETMLDYQTVANDGHPTVAAKAFWRLFCNEIYLVKGPDILSTTLPDNCCGYMYSGCTNLATPPVLAATTLGKYCFRNMFDACRSLSLGPVLPAVTLAEGCYMYMFNACTGLTLLPTVSARYYAKKSCMSMFYGCTNMTNSRTSGILSALYSVPESCFETAFYGCEKLTVPPIQATTTSGTALQLATKCLYRACMGCSLLKIETNSDLMEPNRWRLPLYPMSGTATVASDALTDMFKNCASGTVVTPAAEQEYKYVLAS